MQVPAPNPAAPASSTAAASGRVATAVVILFIFLADHKEPAVVPPIAPQSTQQAAPPAKAALRPEPSKPAEPVESAERAHYRHLCENEKFLADRRKLSDFTQQDLDAIRGCKQMGLWKEQ